MQHIGLATLNFSIKPKQVDIPVFFHNLRGYDSHLLMQAVSRFDEQVTCVPNNMERYMSMSHVGKLKFLRLIAIHSIRLRYFS